MKKCRRWKMPLKIPTATSFDMREREIVRVHVLYIR